MNKNEIDIRIAIRSGGRRKMRIDISRSNEEENVENWHRYVNVSTGLKNYKQKSSFVNYLDG